MKISEVNRNVETKSRIRREWRDLVFGPVMFGLFSLLSYLPVLAYNYYCNMEREKMSALHKRQIELSTINKEYEYVFKSDSLRDTYGYYLTHKLKVEKNQNPRELTSEELSQHKEISEGLRERYGSLKNFEDKHTLNILAYKRYAPIPAGLIGLLISFPIYSGYRNRKLKLAYLSEERAGIKLS